MRFILLTLALIVCLAATVAGQERIAVLQELNSLMASPFQDRLTVVAEFQASDEQASDEQASDEQASDEQASDEQDSEEQDSDKQDSDPTKDDEDDEVAEDDQGDQQEDESLVELPEAEINEKEIRLHLFDGTVITGEMSTDTLTVSTEFGALKIPIEKVMQVTPGLDSYPQLLTNLDELVDQLGASDYNTRQTARKKLSAMGLKIKNELERFTDGGNAERKKHLDELKKEIASQEEEFDDFDEDPIQPYIRGDAVTTPNFTVVGKIEQSQFNVKSKYGDLTVQLQDVKLIDRQRSGGQEIRRSVTVAGNNFIQNNTKSSGIKINKGDVVTISASGSVTMTPWGSNRTSTPEGSTSYGWFVNNEIEGGALCMKIGNSSPTKVGTRHRFTAKNSGVLKLGVGVPQSYINHQYPGEYKVKITVQPGG